MLNRTGGRFRYSLIDQKTNNILHESEWMNNTLSPKAHHFLSTGLTDESWQLGSSNEPSPETWEGGVLTPLTVANVVAQTDLLENNSVELVGGRITAYGETTVEFSFTEITTIREFGIVGISRVIVSTPETPELDLVVDVDTRLKVTYGFTLTMETTNPIPIPSITGHLQTTEGKNLSTGGQVIMLSTPVINLGAVEHWWSLALDFNQFRAFETEVPFDVVPEELPTSTFTPEITLTDTSIDYRFTILQHDEDLNTLSCFYVGNKAFGFLYSFVLEEPFAEPCILTLPSAAELTINSKLIFIAE